MGAVYRATDLVLKRTVAIKVLKDRSGEEVGRKIRLEAQILARLVHDHVVRIYDFGEAKGIYYFVMEEVDGSSYPKRWKICRWPIGSGSARWWPRPSLRPPAGGHPSRRQAGQRAAHATQLARLSDFGLSKMVEQGRSRGRPRDAALI